MNNNTKGTTIAQQTTFRCGDTLHVLIAANAEELAGMVERQTKQLVKPNGHAVFDASGRSVFVIDETIHPTEWHSDGNRVRANRIRREVAADGMVSSAILRKVWVSP